MIGTGSEGARLGLCPSDCVPRVRSTGGPEAGIPPRSRTFVRDA